MAQTYLIDVLPLIALRGSPRSFTYTHSARLPLGAVVLIPFGRTVVRGVVFGKARSSRVRPSSLTLRPIRTVVTKEALTKKQLALAREISAEYGAPLGRTLVHFLPPRARQDRLVLTTSAPLPSPPLTSEAKRWLRLFSQKHTASGVDVVLNDRSALIAALVSFCGRSQRRVLPRSILVLFPDQLLAAEWAREVAHYLPEEMVALLVSSARPIALARAHAHIRGRQARLIFGTRQALFAPFDRLQSVLIVAPEAVGHKQWDMAPRYDARVGAQMLARIHKAVSVRFHSVPTVSYTEGVSFPLAPLLVINIRTERSHKRHPFLTQTLKERLVNFPWERRLVVIITAHAGTGRFSFCTQCRALLRCPDCGYPLAPEPSQAYRCGNCSYHTKTFPGCPDCGHIGFRTLAHGSERAEKEVRRAFPRAHLVRLDSPPRSEKELTRQHMLVEKSTHGFLIGTTALLRALPLQSAGLTVIMDADSFLAYPDFRAEEELLQTLFLARKVTEEQGQVIIQSYRPENRVMQATTSAEMVSLLCSLDAERKDAGFPPHARLLRIEVLRDSAASALADATAIRERLTSLLRGHTARSIVGEGKKYRIRHRYQALVLVRLPKNWFPLPAFLRSFLGSLPKDTFVDLDPLTFY